MAKPYYFLPSLSNVSDIKIKANGTFYTEVQSLEFETATVYAAAYDTNDNIIAGAGTITVSVEQLPQSYMSGVSEGDNPIDLSLGGADATYNVPVFLGACRGAKIVVTGVTFGAVDHIKVMMWRA